MPSPTAVKEARRKIGMADRLLEYAPGDDQLLSTAAHHLEGALELLRPPESNWREQAQRRREIEGPADRRRMLGRRR